MTFTKVTVWLVASAMVSTTAFGALVDHQGRAYTQIVIAENAPGSVTLAAAELAQFARTLCGAELKIVNHSTAKPVIYVGVSPELAALGVTTASLPPEGYAIKTGRDFLALYGNDYSGPPLVGKADPRSAYNPALNLTLFGAAGTLTGVYEFLQKVGGIRFYLPGELGTVVTPVKDLKVPELNLTGGPKVPLRWAFFSFLSIDNEGMLWAKRVGFGGKTPLWLGHSYHEFLTYKDTHPEYFALADGKRAFKDECVADGQGHLCLTNPEVIQRWADMICAYFKDNPGVEVYPLTPGDGLNRICECPNCQAELRPDAGETGKFAYHIWNFTAKVGALVGQRFPGKYVGCIAYEKYRTPPNELKRMPNVAVMFCNWRSMLANQQEAAKLHREIEEWATRVDRFYLWCWYLDHWMPWEGMPVVQTETIQRELRYLMRNPKYGGDFIEAEGKPPHKSLPAPGMEHLNLYFTARLYSEPGLDLKSQFDEYCRRFYGPAEKPMRAFWSKAQARRNELIKTHPDLTPDVLFTTPFILDLRGDLSEAKKLAPEGSVYRNRVELVANEFEGGATRLVRLQAIGVKKAAFPFLKQGFDSLAEVIPEKFCGKNGEDYSPATWVYAGWDRQFLYLRFLCYEPEMSKLKVKVTEKDDGAIWEDDSVEIFISPDETNRVKNSVHLIVNANNVIFDAKVLGAATRDKNWESNAVHAVRKEKNRWILEVKMPFTAFGVNDPNFAGMLAANFYRNRNRGTTTTSSASCWTPTGDYAHFTPNTFALITLKP